MFVYQNGHFENDIFPRLSANVVIENYLGPFTTFCDSTCQGIFNKLQLPWVSLYQSADIIRLSCISPAYQGICNLLQTRSLSIRKMILTWEISLVVKFHCTLSPVASGGTLLMLIGHHLSIGHNNRSVVKYMDVLPIMTLRSLGLLILRVNYFNFRMHISCHLWNKIVGVKIYSP